MRRLRRIALLAIASITFAACLPNRDNAADPANRPSAVLSVATGGFVPYGAVGEDVSPADGCVDVADAVSTVFSRAKCVHLSAAGSSDPQGDSTLRTFGFAIVTSAASVDLPLASEHVLAATLGTASSVVFRAATLRSNDAGAYFARLEVADADGNTHVTHVPITLENSRPIAVPPSPRLVTNWGAAWSTNGTDSMLRPLTIHFSGDASFDPDGDPLSYCWRDRTNQWISDAPGIPRLRWPPPRPRRAARWCSSFA